MQNNALLSVVRFGVVALIWIGVIIFGIALSGNIAGASGEGSPLIGLGIAAFICAAIATGLVLKSDDNEGATHQSHADRHVAEMGKRKNDQRALDAASLLTDDDIAEMRQAIKDDFRRRLAQGEDPAVSFEELLTDRDTRKRR